MGPALRRLIEELPEVGSGLSRTEREVLEEEGSFPAVQAREPVPWITDLFFARVVTELYEAGLFDEPARAAVSRAVSITGRSRATAGWAASSSKGLRASAATLSRIVAP